MMGGYTRAVYNRLYHGVDPASDAAQRDLDIAAYERKCPICDWCDEPITDETFLQRINHKKRKLNYHIKCAEKWFESEFEELFTDDYISSESEA